MKSRRPNEDRRARAIAAPSKYCPRKLTNDDVNPSIKRYMGIGKPLAGYMMACPGCGFCEMHMHSKAGFVEDAAGALTSTTAPVHCINCRRQICVYTNADGTFVEAKRV